MSNAQVFSDSTTLRPGRFGPVTGVLWVALGGTDFPARGWSDFVVVIFEAWVTALVRLARGTSTGEVIHFMDGPFELSIGTTAPGLLELSGRERGKGVKARASVGLVALANDVSMQAEEVLRACRIGGMWSGDADRLEGALPVLRKEIDRLAG